MQTEESELELEQSGQQKILLLNKMLLLKLLQEKLN